MRIGLITPGFSADETDWCIPALLDLVRTLAREHEVVVFALRYPHHRRPYEVYGARVLPCGGAQRRGLGRLLLGARGLQVIRRAARRRPFDVLHGLWAHEPGALAVAAGQLTQTPAVVSLCGGELVDLPTIDYGGLRSPLNRWLATWSLRRAARVTAGSALLAARAKPYVVAGNVDGGRLLRWPLGVETLRFRPGVTDPTAPRLAGTPRLLHVASLVPVKDQTTLLQAFARLLPVHPQAQLFMAGDGPQRQALSTQGASLGITTQLHFLGAVPHGQMPALYGQADLHVASSLFESQGMAVLEAAACGCPTVGTAVGVLPELGAAACSVPPGDPDALAKSLLSVLADPASHAAMGRDARTTVQARFSLDRAVKDLVTLYRTL